MHAVLYTYQWGELWGWQCSHTGADLHAHMLMQTHATLGLAVQHHPRQPHRPYPLQHTPAETPEQRLKHTQPERGRQRARDVGREGKKDREREREAKREGERQR